MPAFFMLLPATVILFIACCEFILNHVLNLFQYCFSALFNILKAHHQCLKSQYSLVGCCINLLALCQTLLIVWSRKSLKYIVQPSLP